MTAFDPKRTFAYKCLIQLKLVSHRLLVLERIMKTSSFLYKFLVVSLLSIPVGIVSANENIVFDSNEVAQDVLLGSKWKCNDASPTAAQGSSLTIIEFDSATKRKAAGQIWKKECPQDPGKITGKFKKNVFVYRIKGLNKDCLLKPNGKLEFYRKDSGELTADGFYKAQFVITKTENEGGWHESFDGRLVCKKE